MDFSKKYYKYKTKYLNLKNIVKGGTKYEDDLTNMETFIGIMTKKLDEHNIKKTDQPKKSIIIPVREEIRIPPKLLIEES